MTPTQDTDDTGRVVVVTGDAVGIGRALAESFAASGATVFGLDRATVPEPRGYRHYDCDISDAARVKDVFADIARAVDHVDVLVNNAGLWNNTALSATKFDERAAAFQDAIGSGLTGSYFCTLAAIGLLEKSDNANVINMLTEHIVPGHYITGLPATGYDCAKFGLWRLTESWAVELKRKGIRVNGLSFGATDTPMLRAVSPAMAEVGMKPGDIVAAVRHLVGQGPDGDTGCAYLFGTNGTSRAESQLEIEALAAPRSTAN